MGILVIIRPDDLPRPRPLTALRAAQPLSFMAITVKFSAGGAGSERRDPDPIVMGIIAASQGAP